MSDYITLTEAAALLPSRPHASAVHRWCRTGVLARSGDRVRLEHWRFGRRIYTTADALGRFAAEVAAADVAAIDRGAPSAAPRPRSDTERERAIAAAEDELRT